MSEDRANDVNPPHSVAHSGLSLKGCFRPLILRIRNIMVATSGSADLRSDMLQRSWPRAVGTCHAVGVLDGLVGEGVALYRGILFPKRIRGLTLRHFDTELCRKDGSRGVDSPSRVDGSCCVARRAAREWRAFLSHSTIVACEVLEPHAIGVLAPDGRMVLHGSGGRRPE